MFHQSERKLFSDRLFSFRISQYVQMPRLSEAGRVSQVTDFKRTILLIYHMTRATPYAISLENHVKK